MLYNNSIKGMGITFAQAKNIEIAIYEACQLGNMKAAPIPISKTAEHQKKLSMTRISTDPVPMGTKSLNGNSIMIVIVDYSTNLIWTYYAKNRKDYAIYLEQFKFDIIDRYGHKCQVLENDCDKAFSFYFRRFPDKMSSIGNTPGDEYSLSPPTKTI